MRCSDGRQVSKRSRLAQIHNHSSHCSKRTDSLPRSLLSCALLGLPSIDRRPRSVRSKTLPSRARPDVEIDTVRIAPAKSLDRIPSVLFICGPFNDLFNIADCMTSNDTDNQFEKKQLWYAQTQYPDEKISVRAEIRTTDLLNMNYHKFVISQHLPCYADPIRYFLSLS